MSVGINRCSVLDLKSDIVAHLSRNCKLNVNDTLDKIIVKVLKALLRERIKSNGTDHSDLEAFLAQTENSLP